MFAAYGTYGYDILKFIHVMFAILGLGAVMWAGGYSMKAMKRGPVAANAVGHVVHEIADLGSYFLYATFVLGFALVGMSDKTFKLSQSWIWLAIVAFIVAIGIVHSMIRPNVKRILAIGDELVAKGPQGGEGGPPPEVAQIAALGKKIGMASMVTSFLGVAIVFLMTVKPGFHHPF